MKTHLIAAAAALTLATVASTAFALDLPGPLVQTEWLANNLQDKNLVILDVRADTAGFTAKAVEAANVPGQNSSGAKKPEAKADAETSGHIPGARLWAWKDVRVNRKVDGIEVLGEMPTREEFTKTMQSLGVNNDDVIVITSDASNTPSLLFATRVYFQLKYFGHDHVAILNGGTVKWKSENRPMSFDRIDLPAGNFTARAEHKELLATTADVQAAEKTGKAQFIDARTTDFYLGQSLKKGEVTAKGHIPGAKNLPHTEYVDDKTHAFKDATDLRQLAKEFGIDTGKPAITFCNTGHLASGAWFVMHELLGDKNVKLYDGSMNEWTARGLPVSKKWE